MHDGMGMHATLANQLLNASPIANPTPANLGSSALNYSADNNNRGSSTLPQTPLTIGSMGSHATLTSIATPGAIRLNVRDLLLKTQESDIRFDVAVMPWGTLHPHYLKNPPEHVPWTNTEVTFIGGRSLIYLIVFVSLLPTLSLTQNFILRPIKLIHV
jgi:hypothetical protein